MRAKAYHPLNVLWLLLALLLAACESAGGEEQEGKTTLVYATMHPEEVDRQEISRFNGSHEDVEIVVRDYSENGGWERLLTEMTANQIPDIFDMRGIWLPYQQLAAKGYLEDLWPYIERDPALGRERVVEAFLRAAEVDGGLYMLFNGVQVDTLVGAESVVGRRNGWSMEELLEAFEAMPEGATVMEYIYPRGDIFFYMGLMCLDGYVDWETGTCSFDGEEFQTFLEFCNRFPKNFDWSDGVEEVNREIARRKKEGLQMLGHEYISGWDDIPALDAVWGGRAAFVGYPTEDGSAGSAFRPSGPCLAISSACRNKEAAWELVRKLILPRLNQNARTWQSGADGCMFLVNRADYECAKSCAMLEKGDQFAREHRLSDGSILPVTQVTEEEVRRFEAFLNRVDKLGLCDSTIYQIAEETCGPYFAGDKTLDETVELVQNRVSLYVNERR